MNRTILIAVTLLGVSGAAAALAAQSRAPVPSHAARLTPPAPPMTIASPEAKSINTLAPQAAAAAIESCIEKTQALLAALDRHDYAGAEMDFNPTMRAGLPQTC